MSQVSDPSHVEPEIMEDKFESKSKPRNGRKLTNSANRKQWAKTGIRLGGSPDKSLGKRVKLL